MAKHIQWNGFGIRRLHGYEFRNGDIIVVNDDQVADDILTQPNENFQDVTPDEPKKKKTTRRKTTKKSEE